MMPWLCRYSNALYGTPKQGNGGKISIKNLQPIVRWLAKKGRTLGWSHIELLRFSKTGIFFLVQSQKISKFGVMRTPRGKVLTFKKIIKTDILK